jgi:hypothetical protein
MVACPATAVAGILTVATNEPSEPTDGAPTSVLVAWMKSMVAVLPTVKCWPDTVTEPESLTAVGDTEIPGDGLGDPTWLGVGPELGEGL